VNAIKRFVCGSVLVGAAGALAQAKPQVTVSVDPDVVRAQVSPDVYGAGMEDVNHEIYGGLDAQRIFGESFEESPRETTGLSGAWQVAVAGPETRFVYSNKMGALTQGARSGNGAQHLISESGAHIGMANAGLHGKGIAVRRGAAMDGSFWACGEKGCRFSVALESADGRRTYARQEVTVTTNGWERLAFALTPEADDPRARFALYLECRGWPLVDDVFLGAPQAGKFAGLGVRCDVAEGLEQTGVNFIRWGGTMANAPDYLLANMLPGERRPYRGYWYREASGGFGVYEFIRLAERMDVPCAFSINVLEKTEDAVRLAEWLRGRPGAHYVQIGNEECISADDEAAYRDYAQNFLRLEGAMRRANPALKFVSAAWWRKDSKNMDLVFDALEGHCEYQDLHPWTDDPAATLEQRKMIGEFRAYRAKRYPNSKLRAVVFEENGCSHGMGRALAHALMMEAVREAGDFVLTSCQANAFQPDGCNDNGWDQGLVFFTPDRVWLQPQAHANRMARDAHRELLVAGRTDDKDVSVSATKSASGDSVVLHLVNVSAQPKTVAIACPAYRIVKATVLSAPSPEADNTRDAPGRIVPRDMSKDFASTPVLNPWSYAVIELVR